jgi:hypothetical protein
MCMALSYLATWVEKQGRRSRKGPPPRPALAPELGIDDPTAPVAAVPAPPVARPEVGATTAGPGEQAYMDLLSDSPSTVRMRPRKRPDGNTPTRPDGRPPNRRDDDGS